MHNLHLARIKAKSHDDACGSVLSFMEDWGNENNWRSVGGSICEDGTKENYDEYARWPAVYEGDGWDPTIETLNKMCFQEIQGKEYTTGHSSEGLNKVLKMPIKDMFNCDEENWISFYTAKKFFRFLIETRGARQECKDAYNIFTSSDFFAYSYGDFGLTDMGNNGYNEEELKDCKTYIVLIDMHT